MGQKRPELIGRFFQISLNAKAQRGFEKQKIESSGKIAINCSHQFKKLRKNYFRAENVFFQQRCLSQKNLE